MPIRRTFEKSQRTFNLHAESIDLASEWLAEKLEVAGIEKSDRLRTRLLFEEALLNLAEHYGEEHEVTAHLEKRWGRCRLRLVVKGSRFNPLRPETELDAEGGWTSLFSVISMPVQYTYSMGANVLRLSLPKPVQNPVLRIMLAIAVGVIVGLAGNMFIPDVIETSISSAILTPISDMWVRLLQAISGPIIFLMALTATFGTKRIADFGGSRFGTVARYFGISALVTIFSLACALPLFPQDVTVAEADGLLVGNTLGAILSIVPGNLVEPFSTANTPQLLIIAIVTGYLLASMESQTKDLMALVQQLSMLGFAVARGACSLVPFFVGLLLCLRIWSHDTERLGSIWLPLVVAALLSGLVCLAALLYTSVRLRVSPLLLVQKLRGSFWEALERGTLDFSIVDDLARSSKELLGVDGKFAQAVLPQGLFLYMPTSAIGICVFVLFAAQMQQLPVNQVWVASVVVASVVLAVATPPVTGANLLSFVVAFSFLGISSDAFLDVMVFDILFGVLCIACDQLMLQIDAIIQADNMGFLDEDVLRAPLAK